MGIYHQKPNIRHLSALASYFSCSCCDIKQTDCYPSSDCGGCIMSQNSLIMMKYTGMTAPPLPDELQTRSNEQCPRTRMSSHCLDNVEAHSYASCTSVPLPLLRCSCHGITTAIISKCHCNYPDAMAVPMQLPK